MHRLNRVRLALPKAEVAGRAALRAVDPDEHVTIRVFAFVISDVETGQSLGHALLCPDARYASITWRGVQPLERRLLLANTWRQLGVALNADLPVPLPSTHPIATVLLDPARRQSRVVQYLSDRSLEFEPTWTPAALDRVLRELS